MSLEAAPSKFAPWRKRGSPAALLRLLEGVARAYNVPVGDLTGASRLRFHAWPRQHFMWLAYETGSYSLSVIGDLLNRDHTTVLIGIRAHAARQEALDA